MKKSDEFNQNRQRRKGQHGVVSSVILQIGQKETRAEGAFWPDIYIWSQVTLLKATSLKG